MEQENNGQLNQIAEALNDIADSMKRDPQAERYHSETHCPSCGRFVGTATRCPYCQTETQKRLSIRIFKIISVLLSTIGLLMLLYYARNVKTPEVLIKDLGPLSNFAHVRIIGTVNQSYGINQWGSLSFSVKQGDGDDSQVVRVAAYSKTAKEIEAKGLVPRKGDKVEFEGQVRVQKESLSMLINASEHIKILKRGNPALNMPDRAKGQFPRLNESRLETKQPSDITADMIKKPVKLIGRVKESQQLEKDCVVIRLENNTEKGLPLFIPEFSKKGYPLPMGGTMVEAVGLVKEYNGEIEVEISNRGFLKVMPKAN